MYAPGLIHTAGGMFSRRFEKLLWTIPLLLFAGDACAWGLYTHIYFSQLLIWLIPIADPRFRNAIRRFPELCLAATCLPDVSLFSRAMRNPVLGATHQWSSVLGLLRNAVDDRERAMAMGYACHLMCDIVAHNHFVPTHEDLWFRGRMVTHASAEWAMDAHIARHLFFKPADLIATYQDELIEYASRRLNFVPHIGRRALGYLHRGESILRRSGLDHAVYRASCWADRAVVARFDHYVKETSERLQQIDRLIRGEVPAWLPEPELRSPMADSPRGARHQQYLALLPSDFFRDVGPR